MPYPLNPGQVPFDDYDDIRAEMTNYLFSRWVTELARTEPVKYPNFPIMPAPQATSTWLDLHLLFGRSRVKCVGAYNNKKIGELTLLKRIIIHSPVSKGTGAVMNVADALIGIYPASFSLRSARLVPGMLPQYKEFGEKAYPAYGSTTKWYDVCVDIPIDLTILM
jgi:hypothetical protein